MPDKVVIVVAESDQNLCAELASLLKTTFEGAVVYTASEGSEAFSKIQNAPPQLLVTGLELGKKCRG